MPEQLNFKAQSFLSKFVAGVDEVGRGSLFGDVVAAAVVLDVKKPINGLSDSKKLTGGQRERVFQEIQDLALFWSVGRASAKEIDSVNILQASLLAMTRSVRGLSIRPSFIYIDGPHTPSWDYPSKAVVKGDSLIPCIAAASIIAKVTRDREMLAMDVRYPGYGFAENKGYPTKQHLQALKQLGPCHMHRTSFSPVSALIK